MSDIFNLKKEPGEPQVSASFCNRPAREARMCVTWKVQQKA
jgi:hypothetical protein